MAPRRSAPWNGPSRGAMGHGDTRANRRTSTWHATGHSKASVPGKKSTCAHRNKGRVAAQRSVRVSKHACNGSTRAGRVGGLESRPVRAHEQAYLLHAYVSSWGGGRCSKLSGALLLGPRPEPSVGHDEATQLSENTGISLDISGSLLIASVPILTLPFLSLPSSPLGPAQASALPSPSARFPASDLRACASVVRK